MRRSHSLPFAAELTPDGVRGEPSGALHPAAFVSFLQNHDQIANDPLRMRIAVSADESALHAAVMIVLLSPQIPLPSAGFFLLPPSAPPRDREFD